MPKISGQRQHSSTGNIYTKEISGILKSLRIVGKEERSPKEGKGEEEGRGRRARRRRRGNICVQDAIFLKFAIGTIPDGSVVKTPTPNAGGQVLGFNS